MTGPIMAVVCMMELSKPSNVACTKPYAFVEAAAIVVVGNKRETMDGWSPFILYLDGDQPKGAGILNMSPR